MKDNWSKLQAKTIDVKKTDKLDRKYNYLKKVISNPDKYNTNLASKNSIISLEQQIEELQEQIDYLSLQLTKHISASPNPYGDDDWATPEDIDLFPGP
jgi:hypothetical protein